MPESYSLERAFDFSAYAAPKISRDYTLALQAGVVVPLSVDGSTIYVKDGDAAVTVQFYPSGRTVELIKGQGENIGPYDSVRISSVAAQSVTLALGHGTFTDNTMISSQEVAVSFQVSDAVANPGDVAIAAGAVEVVSAARATKKQTVLRNPVGSGVVVRVGGVGVLATEGVSLEPGEPFTVDGSHAIYCRNTSGASSVSIQVMELDKS